MVSKTEVASDSGNGKQRTPKQSVFAWHNDDPRYAKVIDNLAIELQQMGLKRKALVVDTEGGNVLVTEQEREISKQSLFEYYIRTELNLGKELDAVLIGFHQAAEAMGEAFDAGLTLDQAKALEATDNMNEKIALSLSFEAVNAKERELRVDSLVSRLPNKYFGWHD